MVFVTKREAPDVATLFHCQERVRSALRRRVPAVRLGPGDRAELAGRERAERSRRSSHRGGHLARRSCLPVGKIEAFLEIDPGAGPVPVRITILKLGLRRALIAASRLEGQVVELEIPALGGRYRGTLAPDGRRITGMVTTVGGADAPRLRARRLDSAAFPGAEASPSLCRRAGFVPRRPGRHPFSGHSDGAAMARSAPRGRPDHGTRLPGSRCHHGRRASVPRPGRLSDAAWRRRAPVRRSRLQRDPGQRARQHERRLRVGRARGDGLHLEPS